MMALGATAVPSWARLLIFITLALTVLGCSRVASDEAAVVTNPLVATPAADTAETSDTATPALTEAATPVLSEAATPVLSEAATPVLSEAATPVPPGPPTFETPADTLMLGLDPLPNDPTGLMDAALDLALEGDSRAVQAMAGSGDSAFIPVLVELLRFPWFRVDEEFRPAVESSLRELASQHISLDEFDYDGANWSQWVAWVGEHPEFQPPAGFIGWKGELFSAMVDPEMGAFLYDGAPSTIRIEEIVWGGVVKDGIPDLTNPPIILPEKASYLNTEDRVFGVSFNGEHRAYPHRILNPHEMVNDVVGGVAFALAY